MTFPGIDQLLPHRPPLLLLDAVCSFEPRQIVCSAMLRQDCPFLKRSRASSVVSLEYMSQAAGAFLGMQRSMRGGADAKPGVGMVVAVRGLRLLGDHIALGASLLVTARLGACHDRAATFDCSLTSDGAGIGSATLTVYEPRKEPGA